MITLYGMSSPNVVKVLLMLEELGEEYTFERRDVILGAQFDEEFRALNPNGKVPIITDDAAASGPLTIWESGAILIYLAEKSGRFLPSSGAERYHTLQWLMFQMAGVGPMFGQAIHFRDRPTGNDYACERYLRELVRLCGVIDQQLDRSPYLAGEDYSIADMAVFPWMRTCTKYFGDGEFGSATRRWYSTIEQRPATVASLQLLDELSRQDYDSMKSASPEQIIRYYGRLRDSQVRK
ncbi:MAG TPA: glutathione S-transferase N-terminal domain-containing protein [Novosphingobium sp.]|nr:glutathione S-transferase N-terminal domain-containing protein [Novosphingobium sp.]